MLRQGVIALLIYGGLVLLTGWSFERSRPGSCRRRTSNISLPSRNCLKGPRSTAPKHVIRQMSDIGLKQPGVDAAVAFPGLSINGFTVAPNAGIVFFTLKPFEERTHA